MYHLIYLTWEVGDLALYSCAVAKVYKLGQIEIDFPSLQICYTGVQERCTEECPENKKV